MVDARQTQLFSFILLHISLLINLFRVTVNWRVAALNMLDSNVALCMYTRVRIDHVVIVMTNAFPIEMCNH